MTQGAAYTLGHGVICNWPAMMCAIKWKSLMCKRVETGKYGFMGIPEGRLK